MAGAGALPPLRPPRSLRGWDTAQRSSLPRRALVSCTGQGRRGRAPLWSRAPYAPGYFLSPGFRSRGSPCALLFPNVYTERRALRFGAGSRILTSEIGGTPHVAALVMATPRVAGPLGNHPTAGILPAWLPRRRCRSTPNTDMPEPGLCLAIVVSQAPGSTRHTGKRQACSHHSDCESPCRPSRRLPCLRLASGRLSA